MNQYDKLIEKIIRQTETLLDNDKKIEILHNRLIKLSKFQMKLIDLKYFKNMSIRSMAEFLKKDRGIVYRQLKQALNILKDR